MINAIIRRFLFTIFMLICTKGVASDFSFVAIGDTSYNGEKDYQPYLKLIDTINQSKPAFTIHIGDIWGGGTCNDDNYDRVANFFDQYTHPLIYTPGDNEWTDCHESYVGRFDPLERLEKVRSMFFSSANSLGKNPQPLVRQSNVSSYKKYVENARWIKEDVLFLTLNIPGSGNNFRYDNIDAVTEAIARTKANVAWIRDAFRIARSNDLKGVVIAFHAEILMNNQIPVTKYYGPMSGPYQAIVKELRIAAERYEKPILLINGDSHAFVIDRPLMEPQGESAPPKYANVMRLEVYGAPEIKAVNIKVEPSTPWVFSFSPLYNAD